MLKLIATMHLFGLNTRTKLRTLAEAPDRERGDVTLAHILWAVFAIAVAGIVTGVILARVNSEAAKI